MFQLDIVYCESLIKSPWLQIRDTEGEPTSDLLNAHTAKLSSKYQFWQTSATLTRGKTKDLLQ